MLPNGASSDPAIDILSAEMVTAPSAESGVPGDAPVLPMDTVAPLPAVEVIAKSVYVSG